ncbi:MAG: TonB-dependent receptor plug domain-containing protein [Bacteroidales bacterium]|nr:TonB-dependent receptor plug domain-containing protein [Bacteroidales bacterium]
MIWLFGIMCVRLHAQDTIMLQSVDVTADRIGIEALKPLVARKLDTIVLQSKSTSSLSDLLIQHSPVFIKTYGPGGVSTASFRGTTASHTLVLWNGFQLNAPTLGQVDFSTIPVFLADDVSLNWGSGTSDNSGGLGGSVNIDNAHHFGDGFLLDLKQTYGSFNTLGSFLTVGNYGKKFSFRVKAYRNSSDNDFEYENLATIPHQKMKQRNADFVDYGVMPEVSLLLGNNIITVSSWNQWNNRNLPPIMPNVFNFNSEELTRDNFSRNFVSFKTYWNTGSLQLKSASFVENQRYFLLTRNPVTDDTVTFINSGNHALILHQVANLGQQLYKTWTLKAKLQWDHERVRSNNYEGEKRRNAVSAYVAINGEPFKCANLNLTARYDFTDGKPMGLFPTLTFSYQLPFYKAVGFTLGYSHNYRNPSLNDLYWYPGGNPDLLPENGRTLDLAIKFGLQEGPFKLDLRSGGYFSNVKNWIQWMPTSYRFWVPENVSKVYARGIENHVDAVFVKEKWKLALSGNYVFTVTTDESEKAYSQGTNGKQLIYIPRHHANFFLNAQWKTWKVSYTIEITGSRSTSYSEQQFFAYDLPAYMLHHIAIGKKIRKFRIELRCNNLFDTDYQNVIWRAMPGRSFEVMGEYRY